MCSTQDTIKMHHADTAWRMGTVVMLLRIGSSDRLFTGWRMGTVVMLLRIGSGGRLYNMADVLNVQLSVCPYVFCPVASARQSGDSRSFASA